MKLTEYRQEFAAFQAAQNVALRRGWRRTDPREPLPGDLFDRYGDLFSLSAVEDLRLERAEAECRFEVERRGLDVLRMFAEDRFAEAAARAVDEERFRALHRSKIRLDGNEYSFFEAEALVASLPRAESRAAVGRQWENIASATADLVAERSQRLDEAARKLGYADFRAQRESLETLFGRNRSALARRCEAFLKETERQYLQILSEWKRNHGLSAARLGRLDVARLVNQDDFPALFPASRLRRVWEESVRGFGIRPRQQPNIEVSDTGRGAAIAARIRIPHEIALVYEKRAGRRAFGDTLRAVARAQQAAWTSTNLPVELRFEGDSATTRSFEHLLGGLVDDPNWLGDLLDVPATVKIRPRALRERLHAARYAAALCLLRCEREAGDGDGNRETAKRLTDMTHIAHTEAEARHVASEADEVGDDVRARFFEAQLRDYLKTKYGEWRRSRKAGDMLIDLWNTGLRYTAEELAAQIGLGPLAPDALVADFDSVDM